MVLDGDTVGPCPSMHQILALIPSSLHSYMFYSAKRNKFFFLPRCSYLRESFTQVLRDIDSTVEKRTDVGRFARQTHSTAFCSRGTRSRTSWGLTLEVGLHGEHVWGRGLSVVGNSRGRGEPLGIRGIALGTQGGGRRGNAQKGWDFDAGITVAKDLDLCFFAHEILVVGHMGSKDSPATTRSMAFLTSFSRLLFLLFQWSPFESSCYSLYTHIH